MKNETMNNDGVMLVINGVRYHVKVEGSGDPLLLLHGFTSSSDNWLPFFTALSEHFRLIAVDLLGHGRTDAPADTSRYTIEQAAADLEAILLNLDMVPAHVLGYSMGGRLALYLAVTRPHLVRKLLLESTSPGLETEAERQQRQASDCELADWIEANGIHAFVERWEGLSLFSSQQRLAADKLAALRQQRLNNHPQGIANSLRGMGTGAQPSLWPRLGELAMPVLLLAGALDEKFLTINRRMAAFMPNATLQLIEEAGHTIHLERPDEFSAAVTKFLIDNCQFKTVHWRLNGPR